MTDTLSAPEADRLHRMQSYKQTKAEISNWGGFVQKQRQVSFLFDFSFLPSYITSYSYILSDSVE